MSPETRYIYCQLLSMGNVIDHVTAVDGEYEIWIVSKGSDLTNCMPAIYRLKPNG